MQGWWGIIITVIIIIIVVLILTMVVWHRQASHKEEMRITVLDLSTDTDHLITPQVSVDKLETSSTYKDLKSDLSILLHHTFNVVVAPEQLSLIDWDKNIIDTIPYVETYDMYSDAKQRYWDLRHYIGLPLMIVSGYTGTNKPNHENVAILHYLIKHKLVDKAHTLLDQVMTQRYDLLGKILTSAGSPQELKITGGYWWFEMDNVTYPDHQILISTEYPKGVLAYPSGHTYRINLLCSTEEFDRLMAIFTAWCSSKNNNPSNPK